MALMRADSVSEAMDAGRLFIAPSQNLTIVDHHTIAMKTIGAMPRRDAKQEGQGRFPSPGVDRS